MNILNSLLNKNKKSQNKQINILNYCFVILFSLLLLYDTKKIQFNSKNCIIPDYINESIGIFLDIINIFVNIGRVNLK